MIIFPVLWLVLTHLAQLILWDTSVSVDKLFSGWRRDSLTPKLTLIQPVTCEDTMTPSVLESLPL